MSRARLLGVLAAVVAACGHDDGGTAIDAVVGLTIIPGIVLAI